MIRVKTRSNEPIEKTLRRFKKRCEKEGLTKDIKKSSYFEKPSEKRRRWLRKLEKEKKKIDKLCLELGYVQGKKVTNPEVLRRALAIPNMKQILISDAELKRRLKK